MLRLAFVIVFGCVPCEFGCGKKVGWNRDFFRLFLDATMANVETFGFPEWVLRVQVSQRTTI
jgi:hypothetical protein